jgi:hypothetical protein
LNAVKVIILQELSVFMQKYEFSASIPRLNAVKVMLLQELSVFMQKYESYA